MLRYSTRCMRSATLACIFSFACAISFADGLRSAPQVSTANFALDSRSTDQTCPSQCACTALAQAATSSNFTSSTGDVPIFLTPASPLYTSRIDAQWSDNCYQNASCIVAPPDTLAMSQTMQIIASCKTKFAIRSGGHNFNVNFSNVDSAGVLIDTVNLNQTSLAQDKATVDVGPGARWQAVFDALDNTGVSVSGARNGLPGVGGSLLGGGFGFFMNQYGVSATGISGAEVVLANGTIVQASSSVNSDLLWAIRGGGPNYGIVTKFTLCTVPVKDIWYLVRVYNETSIPALLSAIANYTALAENDTASNIYISLNPVASVIGFTNTGTTSNPPIFKDFYDIPYVQEVVPSTLGTESTDSLANAVPPGPPERQYGLSIAFKSDFKTLNDSYTNYLPLASKAQSMNGTLDFGLEIVPSNAAKKTAQNTPMGVEPYAQIWFTGTLAWSNPVYDDAMFAITDQLGQVIEQAASAYGGLLDFRFPNDANAEQDVFAGFGSSNVQKLRQVSTKYDPLQIFQKQQNGGFLLDKSAA